MARSETSSNFWKISTVHLMHRKLCPIPLNNILRWALLHTYTSRKKLFSTNSFEARRELVTEENTGLRKLHCKLWFELLFALGFWMPCCFCYLLTRIFPTKLGEWNYSILVVPLDQSKICLTGVTIRHIRHCIQMIWK